MDDEHAPDAGTGEDVTGAATGDARSGTGEDAPDHGAGDDASGAVTGDDAPESGPEELLRALAPQALGAVVRRYGHFAEAEDATQEALIAAARRWPEEGVPQRPLGWLIRVASRRLTDALRADSARRAREERAVALESRVAPGVAAPGAADGPGRGGDGGRGPSRDDTLTLLFLCCHPALSPPAQVALTLRAVGGLTTAEIARAHLEPETTIAQRIGRAKRRLRGEPFAPPGPADRDGRLAVVLQVLYVVFTEGYTATAGQALHRAELAREAIRLTREVAALLPGEGAVTGLLALMLLTDARRPARTGPDGELVPLDEQDRTRWDRAAIAEGIALVERALSQPPIGAYALQAAIAALHDEAARAQDTDWPQILGLYDELVALAEDPMARLGRAVAVAMVSGPEAGLREVDVLEGPLGGHHRLAAVRAHLLERAGRPADARTAYRLAAERTLSLPERRYLLTRAAALEGG